MEDVRGGHFSYLLTDRRVVCGKAIMKQLCFG